jgi:hypothetical protein
MSTAGLLTFQAGGHLPCPKRQGKAQVKPACTVPQISCKKDVSMKIAHSPLIAAMLASTALLALAGCGKSDDASQGATPDNVEMPAAELPAAEPSAEAPPPAPAADASQAAMSAEDAAKSDADSAMSAAAAAKAAAAEADKPQ